IQVRSGLHCCRPLMEHLGLLEGGTVRASVAAYTTEEEIDLLVAAVDDIGRGR
ncbi:MAG: aminotransferase class V-fold PLP-dependent enzyme, partial [Clostridiaceae bacterium]|nr:aminotransferase class V-fold PLP-dependent enzyme [Clostridiaceae bacterium]